MGANKTLHEAKYILRRLESQAKQEFTKSGLYHLCRSKSFKRADDMLPALDLLIEYCYLKKRVYYQPTGGGPKAIATCLIRFILTYNQHHMVFLGGFKGNIFITF